MLAERVPGPRRVSGASPAIVVVAVALAGWIVSTERMRGMDMGLGADLGSISSFLGLWVTMMAAMMLPSALPMVLLFARVSRGRRAAGRHAPPTAAFVAGYLLVWTASGAAGYLLYRSIAAADLGFIGWERRGPLVAGAALAAAGLYELSSLKRTCLRHCRGPLHFVLGGWRPGTTGALRMGIEHGAYCLGCCWGLMLILFALGLMSLTWMAVVTAIVFVEKVLPGGDRLRLAVAAALVGLGIWVASAPESVPGLGMPTPM